MSENGKLVLTLAVTCFVFGVIIGVVLDVIDELEGVIFDIQNEEAEKVLKEYWDTNSDEL